MTEDDHILYMSLKKVEFVYEKLCQYLNKKLLLVLQCSVHC